jgi:cystathionine beta-lyase family protein involved in aluminum resistance
MTDIEKLVDRAQNDCAGIFASLEETEIYNTRRVLSAMQKHEVASRHFAPTTGYGYGDIGRDTLEAIFADVFHTEAAIVRPHIASGTHALSLCLFGLLLPGDHLLSASGKPYDTLDEVIGIAGQAPGSLKEMNVSYSHVELNAEGKPDLDAIKKAIRVNTRVIMVQRSRGYAWRNSLNPEDIKPLHDLLNSDYPGIHLMVDNCYGEFVQKTEPSHYGADICVGSLIKNPGGGLAPTGGYIVGKEECIRRIASRLTAPGIGLEVGSYAGSYLPFYQGLFLAPHTVHQALKTAILAARAFELLGMITTPSAFSLRSDIIQAIEMQTPARLIAFCQGIQAASPVDSMAVPEPWDMPGYQNQVIMAAGTFVSGASIELSADAPMREPYIAYLQGGLTFGHGKIALMNALAHMQQTGCLN